MNNQAAETMQVYIHTNTDPEKFKNCPTASKISEDQPVLLLRD